MIYRIAFALLLLITVKHSVADAVIFQTDFQSPPDNWFVGGQWTFGEDGAVMHRTAPVWDDVLFTQLSAGGMDPIYFIPDGTDSLLIEIPYYIYVNNSEVSGGADFYINAFTDPGTDQSVFSLYVWQEGVYSDEGIIEYVYQHQGSGWLGFFIESTGGHEPGCGIVAHWEIHSITVTAFGDTLGLHQNTWASIKSSYM